MDDIIEKVRRFIDEKKLLSPGDRVLLSLSAGKDSMAMLEIMVLLRAEYNLELGVFHLNHLMRGKESDLDEEFVSERARLHGIPCWCERYDFRNNPRRGASFEEKAREIRYGLLSETASLHACNRIATAHHQGDNAETLLMRLFSGTGIHGLRGISYKRENIIRPMLTLAPEEIIKYLDQRRIHWREDASNADNSYLRNHARNILTPLIRERYPRFQESLTALASMAGESLDLTDRLIGQIHGSLVRMDEDGPLLEAGRIDHDSELFSHMLASLVRKYTGSYVNAGMLGEIRKRYKSPRSHVLLHEDASIRIVKMPGPSGSLIRIGMAGNKTVVPLVWSQEFLPVEGENLFLDLPDALLRVHIFFKDFNYFQKNRLDKNHIFVTIDPGETTFCIRNRRDGDRIHLDTGTKKIKDLFIEKKLDNEGKNRVPLLIIGTEIAAVMTGFTTGFNNRVSQHRIVRDASSKILAIRKIQGKTARCEPENPVCSPLINKRNHTRRT